MTPKFKKPEKPKPINPRLQSLVTEKSVISVLMMIPQRRVELVSKYPSLASDFFSVEQTKKLFRVVMDTKGVAAPSSIAPRVPELIGSDYDPTIIYDGSSFDADDRFWKEIEELRKLDKKRKIQNIIIEHARKVVETEDIDSESRIVGEKVMDVNRTSAVSYDPTMGGIFSRFEKRKAENVMGRNVSVGHDVLDTNLGGGLQKDPGELVIISGGAKNRKTSCVSNFIAAFNAANVKGGWAWITNEHSLDSIQVMGNWWAQEATRFAIQRGVMYRDGGTSKQFSFSRDDVLMRDHYGDAGQCVKDARDLIESWNVRVYCLGFDDGNSGDAEGVIAKIKADIEYGGIEHVVVDNFQGWRKSAESEHDVMLRTAPLVSEITGYYKVLTIAISQYNDKSQRLLGGGNLEGMSNLILATKYDGKTNPNFMEIELAYGRTRPYFKTTVRIDPKSGLFYNEKIETKTVNLNDY